MSTRTKIPGEARVLLFGLFLGPVAILMTAYLECSAPPRCDPPTSTPLQHEPAPVMMAALERTPMQESDVMDQTEPIDRIQRIKEQEAARDDFRFGLPESEEEEIAGERWSFIDCIDEMTDSERTPDYAQLWSVQLVRDAYLDYCEAALILCEASGESLWYLPNALLTEPERFKGCEYAAQVMWAASDVLRSYMNPDDVEQGD